MNIRRVLIIKNDKELIDKIKKELESLNQDELYGLLVDCGIQGLIKLPNKEKGKVIIREECNNGT